jgi:hypothetical protein
LGNLLKGDPLVIMLDELPPYFENAKSKTIGNSDLSVVSATALSNLLVAIGKDELSNVCLVITDLTASYAGGSQQIIQALNDLDKETGRSAMSLEPVRMNTDEFYLILRKRIFAELPDKETIAEVAQAYAKSIRDARQMDVTNASPTGHAIQGRNKGWRKAVRYALTENPVTDSHHEPLPVFELAVRGETAAQSVKAKRMTRPRSKSGKPNAAEY